jgi:hypothetical protein
MTDRDVRRCSPGNSFTKWMRLSGKFKFRGFFPRDAAGKTPLKMAAKY